MFASDRSGWWNLERVRDGERAPLHSADAEFGYPAWVFGARSYAFLDDGRIVCGYEDAGFTRFGLLDAESGELRELDIGLDSWRSPYVWTEGSSAVFVGGSVTAPTRILRVDTETSEVETVRDEHETRGPRTRCSRPAVSIDFPTEGGLTAHALFYPPTNRRFEAPDGELAPLIVESHGGPTGSADPSSASACSSGRVGASPWSTSTTAAPRATDAPTASGSNGNWGIVDLEDCVNAARFLVDAG